MKPKIPWSIQSYLIFTLVTSAIALGSIVSVSVAIAAYKPPPKQKRPSSYSITAGRRGNCEGIEAIPLTTLAPKTHVGQTVSTHPTFVWFVPNASKSLPVEFRLFEYDADDRPQPISEPITMSSLSGIMKFAWSEDKPNLKVDKTYLWEVRIRCDPNRPSNDLKARADLRVIPMLPNITENTVPIDSVARVKAYGESGLWYNALGEALRAAPPSQLGAVGAELLHQLATVEAEQLNKISNDKEQRKLEQWVEDLRQIAEREVNFTTNYQ